jgi:beta-glucanase (GH16 family)
MSEKYVTVDGVRYELTFEDTFEGEMLDPTKWALCPEQCRQDIGGWWRDSMTEVHDGRLTLWAGLDSDGRPVSGGIRTKDIFEQAKGYFVCRMKMHKTTGFWGAFWMMCGEVFREDGSGVSGVEIDIIESGERARGSVNHALHWDGYGAAHKSVVQVVHDEGQYDGDFHTYALRWTDDAYIFYVDGKETWRTAEPGICDKPGYMKLTTEFGHWAAPVVPEELPDCVQVDWVRAYREVKE